MYCNQQRCALQKVKNDILQLFPLLLSKEAARETLSHLCLWLQLSVLVKVTTLLCWITVVWIVTTSILSWRLWGIISTVTGDNNQIMTGSLILWTAALQFHTSQLWWQHIASQVFIFFYLCVYVVTCIHLWKVTWGSCYFSALYNHIFLLLDCKGQGISTVLIEEGERYIHSPSSPIFSLLLLGLMSVTSHLWPLLCVQYVCLCV